MVALLLGERHQSQRTQPRLDRFKGRARLAGKVAGKLKCRLILGQRDAGYGEQIGDLSADRFTQIFKWIWTHG